MKKCFLTIVFLSALFLLGFANEEPIKVSIESYKVWILRARRRHTKNSTKSFRVMRFFMYSI
jgi:hypothetical protein